jgi:hypothetical protein
MVLSLWAFSGTFMLCILTWQDMKRMLVDDRHNRYMLGATMMLLAFIPRGFWYIVTILAAVMLLWAILSHFKAFGQGDINGLAWISLGFGYVYPGALLWFMLIFAGLVLVQLAIKRWLLKVTAPSPLYLNLLLAFICTSLMFGFYGR